MPLTEKNNQAKQYKKEVYSSGLLLSFFFFLNNFIKSCGYEIWFLEPICLMVIYIYIQKLSFIYIYVY